MDFQNDSKSSSVKRKQILGLQTMETLIYDILGTLRDFLPHLLSVYVFLALIPVASVL